jgi:hypothetical protein
MARRALHAAPVSFLCRIPTSRWVCSASDELAECIACSIFRRSFHRAVPSSSLSWRPACLASAPFALIQGFPHAKPLAGTAQEQLKRAPLVPHRQCPTPLSSTLPFSCAAREVANHSILCGETTTHSSLTRRNAATADSAAACHRTAISKYRRAREARRHSPSSSHCHTVCPDLFAVVASHAPHGAARHPRCSWRVNREKEALATTDRTTHQMPDRSNPSRDPH